MVGLVGAGDGNIDGTNWRCFGAKQPVDQKERSTRAQSAVAREGWKRDNEEWGVAEGRQAAGGKEGASLNN